MATPAVVISDEPSRPDHTLPSQKPREEELESLEPRVVKAARPAYLSTGAQLLAGGVAGAVSKTCTAPLARLTILFQVEGMRSTPGTLLQRPSIMREAARIVREEGIAAFWKGNVVTIIHRLPYSAINFFAYEKYKSRLIEMTGVDPGQQSLSVGVGIKLVAGGGAGVTAASLTYPLDLVRTRLAAQTSSRYYKGIGGTLGTIAKDEGLRGLYKGMGATLLGVGPAIAINFCVYETLKANWGATTRESPGPLVSLACGSLAGLCSSTATFPLDLVRRRMQLEGAGGRPAVASRGIPGTFRHIVRTEGWLALYRGIIPEYYKVVPGVSIAFLTYETMKRLLRRPAPED